MPPSLSKPYKAELRQVKITHTRSPEFLYTRNDYYMKQTDLSKTSGASPPVSIGLDTYATSGISPPMTIKTVGHKAQAFKLCGVTGAGSEKNYRDVAKPCPRIGSSHLRDKRLSRRSPYWPRAMVDEEGPGRLEMITVSAL